jgi:hypothetical protein
VPGPNFEPGKFEMQKSIRKHSAATFVELAFETELLLVETVAETRWHENCDDGKDENICNFKHEWKRVGFLAELMSRHIACLLAYFAYFV